METVYSFESLTRARTHTNTSDDAVTNPKRKFTFLRYYYLSTALINLPFYICAQKSEDGDGSRIFLRTFTHILLLLLLFAAIEFSLCGSSPYTCNK
jgi:integral membrane sensor domain MASE1